MKISCIIIDDEPSAIEVLTGFSNKVKSLEVLSSFRDPLKALEFLSEHQVDLIFLDINMPELNGMEFAKILINPPLIIFTTAYSEYAVESYEKNAVDYLLKPITLQRFLTSFNKVQNLLKNKTAESSTKVNKEVKSQEIIHIKDGHKINRIGVDDIHYLEKEGHYVTFHLENNKRIVSRLSMKEIFELLPDSSFIQVHKSYIVPVSNVEIIEKHQLKLGDSFVPIGKTFRNEVHAFFKSKR